MEIVLCSIVALLAGYIIGITTGGVHIYTGNKPAAPSKKNEEPVYNEDYSHMLPPDVQDYLLKNNGQIK